MPPSKQLGGSEALTCLYVNLTFFRNKSVQETFVGYDIKVHTHAALRAISFRAARQPGFRFSPEVGNQSQNREGQQDDDDDDVYATHPSSILIGPCIDVYACHGHIRNWTTLIDYSDLCLVESFMLFLDFPKAFDTIEHIFIFHALEKFGFGSYFNNAIKL